MNALKYCEKVLKLNYMTHNVKTYKETLKTNLNCKTNHENLEILLILRGIGESK